MKFQSISEFAQHLRVDQELQMKSPSLLFLLDLFDQYGEHSHQFVLEGRSSQQVVNLTHQFHAPQYRLQQEREFFLLRMPSKRAVVDSEIGLSESRLL